MKEEGLFAPNEKVLCFHGPLIYEAKVLKAVKKEKEWTYLIHYAGWSKSWDDYVPESRLLKYNEENLKRQKDHKAALSTSVKSTNKKSSGGAKSTTPSGGKRVGSVAGDSTTSSGNVSATESRPSTPVEEKPEKSTKAARASSSTGSQDKENKKRKTDTTVESVIVESVKAESEEKHELKQEIRIALPEALKTCLVDDWDLINRQKKIFTIPARRTVDSILDEFKETRKNDNAALEFCLGLRQYFNVMLGCQLLYRFERQQYGEVLRREREEKTAEQIAENPLYMSSLYGAAHLLRLLTKMGGCLAYTQLNQQGVHHLQVYIGYFVEFLLANLSEYYNPHDYGMSTPDYQRKCPL